MNECKRWIEEGPPEAVERLLQAAEAEQPSDGSLRRVLAGVGVGLGATSTAASAGAAATAATGTGAMVAASKGAFVMGAWTKWVALGVAAVGTGTVAVRSATTNSERTRVVATAPARVHPTPPAKPASPPVVPAVAAPYEPVVEVPPIVAKARPSLGPSPKPAAVAETEPPVDAERLAEEVRIVDSARSALAQGRAAATLSVLNEYDSLPGAKKFAPEALYLRMQALLSLGRNVDARSTAERLVRTFPQSPHTARARRVLETIP